VPEAPPEIRVIGIAGLPEIAAGADLPTYIAAAARAQGTPLRDGDILVVTQKIVSKAEGRTVDLATIEPSDLAARWAADWGKDPRQIEVALREARRIVRMANGVLITETRHGFVCANSGVDASNSSQTGVVILLPEDPDASARRIREAILGSHGALTGVIISDTFGRPWREGLTNVAIGVAGIEPLVDYRGQQDATGYDLQVTVLAAVDELASAAELVMGKLDRVPVAIIRGYRWRPTPEADSRPLLRDASRDLFR
jgi:coenzyme F420-0:L-glutamate ligase/coenzyme F420-1:gamma-L-glutamate ligase